MQIAKVWCKDFMCIRDLTVDLENYKVTLVTEDEPGSGKEVLITAIEFITNPKYILKDVASDLAFESPYSFETGYVQIKFKNSDPEHLPTYITVTRTFSDIDLVSIETVRSIVTALPLKDFQEKYKTHVTYMYPYIELNLQGSLHQANLFSFFEYEHVNSANKALSRITKWVTNRGYKLSDQINCDFFKIMLENLYQLSILERMQHMKTFMKLSNIVNIIFQKITDDRYSVHNVIRSNNGVEALSLKDISHEFSMDIITIIKAGNDVILWNNAASILQLLLHISVEIAIAFHFDIPVLFIRNVEELSRHQEFQYVKSKLAGNSADKGPDGPEINYLQNIISICEKIDLQAIIEYSGCVQAKNCNILLCTELTCTQLENVSESRVEDILKDLQEFI